MNNILVGPVILVGIALQLAACQPGAPGVDPLVGTAQGVVEQSMAQKATLQARFKGTALEPEMVLLAAGTFEIGCNRSEDCRFDELPPRTVLVPAFEMGKFEVSFDEWDACFADGGCARLPSDRGWARGRQPVIFVSWNETQQYINWLNQKTGKRYRLPTEAEFEYALRAGTRTPFWTGNCIQQGQANFDATKPTDGCPEAQRVPNRPLPVGSFAANPWGLHDMAGNVAEWVQDCWRYNHKGRPRDASAVASGDCNQRPARGGSWYDRADFLRSASRDWLEPIDRMDSLGFRLARSIDP